MSLRSRRLLSVVSDVGAGVSERLRGQSVAPVNLMVSLPALHISPPSPEPGADGGGARP